MAACLHALADDRVCADVLEAFGQSGRGSDRQHLDARGLEGVHVGGRVAGAGGDDGHPSVDDDLHEIVDVVCHEHDVDAERPVGAGLCLGDLGGEHVGGHAACTDDAEPARVTHGYRQLCGRRPSHAALDDRVLDAQELGEPRPECHCVSLLGRSFVQRTTAAPQVRPAPNPTSPTRSPGWSCPLVYRSSRASGIDAEEVLP